MRPILFALIFIYGCVPAMSFADDKSDLNNAWKQGEQMFDLGRYSEAVQQYEVALRFTPKVYGENHANTGDIVYNVANMHSRLGHHAKAELNFQRSLKIFEAVYGKDHQYVADALNGLALIYGQQGKLAMQETLLERCLAISEKAGGKNHPDVAKALNNLGQCYQEQGRRKKAEGTMQRCLEIIESSSSPNPMRLALALQNLGNLYSHFEEFALAEPHLERSLKVRETSLGKDHPEVAQALSSLAGLYKSQGKYAKAEPLFRRSLDIREVFLGKDHPDVANTLNNLSTMYLQEGKFDSSIPLQTRLRQATRSYLLRELPSLSPSEQQVFLTQTETTRFAIAMSLGRKLSSVQSVANQSAEWLLNGKAIGLESQALNTALERQADPVLQMQLNDLRAQEARIALKAAKADELEVLQSKRRKLEKTIAQSGGVAEKLVQPWINLQDVRNAIPADGVLVEITRFKPRRFEAKDGEAYWEDPRYVAWLIPPKGDIKIVDLGDAAAIEATVKNARATMANAPKRIREIGELNATEEMTDSLRKFSDIVIKPLQPYLGTAKSLILSPDGELWLVPWAALPVDKDRFLIEDYAIRYVITGRDLVESTLAKKLETSPPLMLADPNFDGSLSKSIPSNEGTERAFSVKLPKVLRLPGTANEAEAVFPRLQSITGSKPVSHTDNKATEAVVKTAKRPRMLILATHGFFLPTQEAAATKADRPSSEATRTGPLLTKDGEQIENPLLRCGLLLSGCNKRGSLNPGEDDGILTGLEIVGTDLRCTEMVVLSACETGLGEVQNGQGVAGLRQAFQLAGAESVVSTLWQIPDVQSAQLMVGFFDNLTKKMPRDEALRVAQLERIKTRRERFGAAHPYFWAAFTLTGRVK